jgi:hypothetical protein
MTPWAFRIKDQSTEFVVNKPFKALMETPDSSSGICRENGSGSVGFVFSKSDKSLRFATITKRENSVDLVTTWYEDFRHHLIYNDSDRMVISPSDEVLGILPFKEDQYNFSFPNCNISTYPEIASIDNLYAAVVGSFIHKDWKLLEGYWAESVRTGRVSRLRVQWNKKPELVLIGFAGNSVTIMFTLPVKPEGGHDLSFDHPTKWTKPEKPQRQFLIDSNPPETFWRSNHRQNLSVRIEQWFGTGTHRVTVHNTIGHIHRITGSPQRALRYGYGYWLGRLEYFPEITQFGQEIFAGAYYWYHVWMNNYVIMPDGTKLSYETYDTATTDALIAYWQTLIGRECVFHNGDRAYVGYDFQVITFDGVLMAVHLWARINSKHHVYRAYIEQCKLVEV